MASNGLRLHVLATVLGIVSFCIAMFAQSPAASQGAPTNGPTTNYVVGARDVLMITCYDQIDLSGKFTVEADGTFTYPLIGRIKVSGLTIRDVEAHLVKELKS